MKAITLMIKAIVKNVTMPCVLHVKIVQKIAYKVVLIIVWNVYPRKNVCSAEEDIFLEQNKCIECGPNC